MQLYLYPQFALQDTSKSGSNTPFWKTGHPEKHAGTDTHTKNPIHLIYFPTAFVPDEFILYESELTSFDSLFELLTLGASLTTLSSKS